MAKIMDLILPILSILGYWAIILGSVAGPGILLLEEIQLEPYEVSILERLCPLRTDSERIPNGFRTDSERIPNGLRTAANGLHTLRHYVPSNGHFDTGVETFTFHVRFHFFAKVTTC